MERERIERARTYCFRNMGCYLCRAEDDCALIKKITGKQPCFLKDKEITKLTEDTNG